MNATAAATCAATLVDQWIRDGVRHAVVSPGSRSTPLVLAVSARPELTLHVHHDERSAGFLAVGIAVATRLPALVITTSGTAAVELHPAVVEASYGSVPLIACTADRPPELQGVGAPQTIDQRDLFSTAARAFVPVGVPDSSEAGSWRELARRAFEIAVDERGPVHLNLAYRDPLVGSPDSLPPELPARPMSSRPIAEVDPAALAGRRGVCLAGGGAGAADAVATIARRLGWPVIADPRSGCRVPGTIAHADAILRVSRFVELHRPETILRFGALPASRVVNEWVVTSGAPEIVVADRVDDPHRTVTASTSGDLAELADALAPVEAVSPEWLAGWSAAQTAAESVLSSLDDAVLSEPAVARSVLGSVPDGSVIVTASSMPVRDVEWYAKARAGVIVHANRGANGIDGVTSTAVGIAATGQPTTLIIGDLAFLHDTNGLLGLRARSVDLTMVVVDNRGGGIFSFLPQARLLDAERFERLFGTPHEVDIAALARAHGIDVVEPQTVSELNETLSACAGARLVVVRTDRAANVAHHESLNAAVAEAVEATLSAR